MIRGPHPDPVAVAWYVSYGGEVIEETLLSVGYALARFFGARYLRDRQMPLHESIHAMRKEAPLK